MLIVHFSRFARLALLAVLLAVQPAWAQTPPSQPDVNPTDAAIDVADPGPDGEDVLMQLPGGEGDAGDEDEGLGASDIQQIEQTQGR